MRSVTVFLILIFQTLLVCAQNVQFSASAPGVVSNGEQFEITFTVTAQPSGFKPPEFKNFTLLGGPSTSSSSSFQMTNGRTIQSMSISYTYYLQANNVGKFTIEGAKVTVDGKSYVSNSVTIEVVKGQASSQQQSNQQQGGSSGSGDVVAEVGNEDLFVRVIVDKTSLYQGEHVVASIKFFSKLNISAIENIDYPSFGGFFRQDIETQPLRSLQRENVNGQIYLTGVIQKMVLFPQKSGQLTIDPLTLQCIAQVQVNRRSRSVFDDFFGPSVQEVRKKVKSKPININVKPLPGNKPDSYQGAVGNFTFKASVDKNRVKSNDAVSLKYVITGNGNLKMIEPLKPEFPADFETYDPKVNVNATVSVNGVSGTKTIEYLIIPRHSGNYKIPSVDFTYFDTQSKQFKTVPSGEFEITVDKSADEGSNAVVSGISKEDVKFIGKDIQFIKTRIPEFKPINSFIFGSLAFYLIYIIAILLFSFWVILWRKRLKDNANVVLVKNRKANKVAQKRLKDAHASLKSGNKDLFYENVVKALWGYMSDKLSISVSELSRERVLEEASTRQINNELMQRFMEVVDSCEYARYTPGDPASQMDSVYKSAISIVSDFEQNVR
jgi:hypothetical protein